MKNLEEIIEFLKNEIQEITMESFYSHSMSKHDNFVTDFKLDSLDYAQLVLAGESFVQGKLNENKINWKELQTIEQMAKALYGCQYD